MHRLLFGGTVARRLRSAHVPRWLASSPWLDREWYLATYADVAASGIDPAKHFWRYGRFQARSPGPRFDALRYEAMNPRARGGRALSHYRRLVRRGGSATPPPDEVMAPDCPELASGLFDADWYLRRYPDSARFVHPFVDWYRSSVVDPLPRLPGPLFDRAEQLRRLLGARSTGAAPVVTPEMHQRHQLASVCVMIHAYYVDVLDELLRAVRPLGDQVHLLISVGSDEDCVRATAAIDAVFGPGTPRVVKCCPNRGRNFAPLLCAFAEEVKAHEYLLHLHTKRSLYSGRDLHSWRNLLVTSLTGDTVFPIMNVFAEHPAVGVVQPPMYREMPPWASHWLGNTPRGREVFTRCGLDPDDAAGYVDFPVGGMFWARVDALRPLFDAGFTVEDFDPEAGQVDCTLAHAIERSINAVARSRGYTFVEVDLAEGQWRLGWSSRNAEDFGLIDRGLVHRQLASSQLVSVDLFGTIAMVPVLDTPEPTVDSPAVMPRRWLVHDLRNWRTAGRRYVLMADTALDRAQVQAVLAACDASDLFDELYLSSERGVTKESGDLWRVVEAAERRPGGTWLHIGDGEQADIQRALEFRVGWSHVPSPQAVAQYYAPDGRLERGDALTMAVLGLSASTLYSGVLAEDQRRTLGYAVLGPLTVAGLDTDVRELLYAGHDSGDATADDAATMAEEARRFGNDLAVLFGGSPPAGTVDAAAVQHWVARIPPHFLATPARVGMPG